jgi:GDP-L-fucose synthase
MNTNNKIYIAGHRGMVGSAIKRLLESRNFKNIIVRTHDELDLTNQLEVKNFFSKENPDYVILAAARVGGIFANSTYPADFIYQNLMIEANVINSAYQSNVKRLLYLGSTCIYPKAVKQPMREDALLTDVLEPTNEPYAIAKIAGIKLCESYNRQYKTDFRSVMPTNLYGINDNFHPKDSHVIPGLMQRFHKAKINNDPQVTIWGSGGAMREFLYVDDMAAASLFVLELDADIYKNNTESMISHINVGTGKDVTIKKLAETMKQVVGYDGKLVFDKSKPDGAARKLIDVTRLKNMGWKYSTDLKQGLNQVYSWYSDSIK